MVLTLILSADTVAPPRSVNDFVLTFMNNVSLVPSSLNLHPPEFAVPGTLVSKYNESVPMSL